MIASYLLCKNLALSDQFLFPVTTYQELKLIKPNPRKLTQIHSVSFHAPKVHKNFIDTRDGPKRSQERQFTSPSIGSRIRLYYSHLQVWIPSFKLGYIPNCWNGNSAPVALINATINCSKAGVHDVCYGISSSKKNHIKFLCLADSCKNKVRVCWINEEEKKVKITILLVQRLWMAVAGARGRVPR